MLLVESVLIVFLNSLEFCDGSSLWMCHDIPLLSHGLRADTAGGTGRAKGTHTWNLCCCHPGMHVCVSVIIDMYRSIGG